MTKLRDVPHDFAVRDAVVSFVAGQTDGRPHPSGSGVFIAPGLALTASHVLEDFSKHFSDPTPWRQEGTANFGVSAIQYSAGSSEPVVWDVWSASFLHPLDIAAVQMAPRLPLPDNFGWPYITLDALPPDVGSRVQAFGFPSSTISFDNGKNGWSLDEAAAGAVGQITQLFPERRDSTMPYPSFEMNLQVLGGMSGGPVFGENGCLCGILRSSFAFTDDSPDVSYASLLWPSLGLRLRATEHLGIWNGADTTIGELSKHGAIDAINYEGAVRVSSKADA